MPGFYVAAWSVATQIPQGTKDMMGLVLITANNAAEAEGHAWQWLRHHYPADKGYMYHLIVVNEFTSLARAFVAAHPEEVR